MDGFTAGGHLIIILLLLRQDIMKLAQRVKVIHLEMKNGKNGPKNE